MSELGDLWRDVKKLKQQAKRARWEQNRTTLHKLADKFCFTFTVANEGTGHVIINKSIDLYLSTGTWIARGNKRRGVGFRQLVHYLKSTDNIVKRGE